MLDLILRRWPLKILALALAFAIWLAIRGEGRIVRDYAVPVVVTLGSDAILEGNPPKTVTVRLRGPDNVLQSTTGLDLQVAVDLRDADVGERNVVLSEPLVEGRPPGIQVDSIEPDRIVFEIARRERRVVPVVPAFVGRPAPGYAFYEAHADPDRLEIEGPASKVAAVDRLRTDPVHLDGRREPFSVRVGAVPESSEIRIRKASPIEVHAIVDVAPVEASYPGIPVTLAGVDAGASCVPSRVDVTLSGPPGVLDRILASNVRATADASGRSGEPGRPVPVRIDFVGVPIEDLSRVTIRRLSHRDVDVRAPGLRRSS